MTRQGIISFRIMTVKFIQSAFSVRTRVQTLQDIQFTVIYNREAPNPHILGDEQANLWYFCLIIKKCII